MKHFHVDHLEPSCRYAISQLFNSSVLTKLNSSCDEIHIKDLIEGYGIYPEGEEWNLIKGFEVAYAFLKEFYRCEYVYKNEITNQILLRFHNDNSATLLKEVPSDSSIADLVIVNGHTTAYEIKTELDKFDRLNGQLMSYRYLYDHLNIVTYPSAVNKLKANISGDVGIIVFDKDGILKIERESENNEILFNSSKAVLTLRQSELVSAYRSYIGDLPIMGTAKIHMFCYEWYLSLNQFDAHKIFAEALKGRKLSKYQFELVKRSPVALKTLFYNNNFTKKFCTETMDRLCIFG